MKFRIFGRMHSCPSVKLDTDISPLDFKTSINGHFCGEVGPFTAQIGNIPIRLTIPFLKRRPVMLSIDSFPLKLERFKINVEKAGLDINGTIGLKGIHACVDSKINCATNMDLKGHVAGRVGLSHLDLIEDDDDFKEKGVHQKD